MPAKLANGFDDAMGGNSSVEHGMQQYGCQKVTAMYTNFCKVGQAKSMDLARVLPDTEHFFASPQSFEAVVRAIGEAGCLLAFASWLAHFFCDGRRPIVLAASEGSATGYTIAPILISSVKHLAEGLRGLHQMLEVQICSLGSQGRLPCFDVPWGLGWV